MEVAVVEVAEAAEAPAVAAMTAAEAEAHLLVIFSLSPQAQRHVQRCERVDALATTASDGVQNLPRER